MASVGTPIHGDGKYGGAKAFLDLQGISKNSSTCARYTDQAAKWKRTFHYSGVTKPYEEFLVSAGA